MKPADAIKALDRALAAGGSTLVLKRGSDVQAPDATVTVRGSETALKPEKFVGSSRQGDSVIILSPTRLGAYGEPTEDDWAVFGGKTRSIYFVRRREIDDVLVRLELMVRG
ncbi:MAG: hypothetical protein M9944_08025 [Rhizobiaceae bacterium]|nr:hypothetical protein [Rhizobiaceae bacterium]